MALENRIKYLISKDVILYLRNIQSLQGTLRQDNSGYYIVATGIGHVSRVIYFDLRDVVAVSRILEK